MRRMYSVTAIWDDEAQVFYCESDIDGLHIEAETLDEFQSLIAEHAPELIIANHLKASDIARMSLGDLIPAIVLRAQQPVGHAA